MSINIPTALIDLESFPPSGSAGVSTKMRTQDRDLVYRASVILGMKQADFMRIAMVNTARAVIREAENLASLERV